MEVVYTADVIYPADVIDFADGFDDDGTCRRAGYYGILPRSIRTVRGVWYYRRSIR